MAPAVSYWMQEETERSPRPALEGTVEVDVAVLGAGYTGLWTAYELQLRDPGLRVAVCEAETVGFGASGRNGSWAVAGLGITLGELARRHGDDAARRTTRALRATLDELGAVCEAEGIDARLHRGGALRLARGPQELPAVRASLALRARLGLGDDDELLDGPAVAERVRVQGALGALADPWCATVHPGRLVRSLAGVVEARGATIYERTPVTQVVPRSSSGPPRLDTAAGVVVAQVVVVAGEAWLSKLPGWRRLVLPLYSLIVLTEPVDDDRWAEIGWVGRECLSSQRLSVDYLARTEDGRILFGGRGAPYRFGSRLDPGMDRHGPTHEMLRRAAVEWFPALAGVRFTHAWGGPVGMPRDWEPTWCYDEASGVAAAFGYTGQGVVAAKLAGRVLAEQITGSPTELSELPMARHRPRRWEPEPLRWLAARGVQAGLARVDERARRTGRAPSPRNLAVRLARH